MDYDFEVRISYRNAQGKILGNMQLNECIEASSEEYAKEYVWSWIDEKQPLKFGEDCVKVEWDWDNENWFKATYKDGSERFFWEKDLEAIELEREWSAEDWREYWAEMAWEEARGN